MTEQGVYDISQPENEFAFTIVGGQEAVPAGATAKLYFDGNEIDCTETTIENGEIKFQVDFFKTLNMEDDYREGTTHSFYAILYDANQMPVMYSQTLYTRQKTLEIQENQFETLHGYEIVDGNLVGGTEADSSFTLHTVKEGYGILEGVTIQPEYVQIPEDALLKFEVTFYDSRGYYFDPVVVGPGETAKMRNCVDPGNVETPDEAGSFWMTKPFPVGYRIRGYIENPETMTETPISISSFDIQEQYVGTGDQFYKQLITPAEDLSAKPLVNYISVAEMDAVSGRKCNLRGMAQEIGLAGRRPLCGRTWRGI